MGGVSTRENGLLKLVHPGKHVEIYRKPITAAEILRKYPRHSIVRPDVFQFPWIVVRAESVLSPGKVFFLIPNCTLYNLLKGKGLKSKSSPQESQVPWNHCHTRATRNSLVNLMCWGGTIPGQCKHQQHDQVNRRRSVNMLHQDRTNSHDQDSEDSRSDTSYVDAWTEITDSFRKIRVNSHPRYPSFDSCRSFHLEECHSTGSNVVTSTLPLFTYGSKNHRSSGARTELQSCLRKQDSVRKLFNLKVTFGSPVIIPSSPREALVGKLDSDGKF